MVTKFLILHNHTARQKLTVAKKKIEMLYYSRKLNVSQRKNRLNAIAHGG